MPHIALAVPATTDVELGPGYFLQCLSQTGRLGAGSFAGAMPMHRSCHICRALLILEVGVQFLEYGVTIKLHILSNFPQIIFLKFCIHLLCQKYS